MAMRSRIAATADSAGDCTSRPACPPSVGPLAAPANEGARRTHLRRTSPTAARASSSFSVVNPAQNRRPSPSAVAVQADDEGAPNAAGGCDELRLGRRVLESPLRRGYRRLPSYRPSSPLRDDADAASCPLRCGGSPPRRMRVLSSPVRRHKNGDERAGDVGSDSDESPELCPVCRGLHDGRAMARLLQLGSPAIRRDCETRRETESESETDAERFARPLPGGFRPASPPRTTTQATRPRRHSSPNGIPSDEDLRGEAQRVAAMYVVLRASGYSLPESMMCQGV